MQSLLILAALSACLYIARLAIRRLDVPYIISIGFVIFLSSIPVVGLAASLFSLPVNAVVLSLGTLILMAGAALLGHRRSLPPMAPADEHPEKVFGARLAVYLGVVLGIIGLLLFLGKGSLLPRGLSPDAGGHYYIVSYIFDEKKLPGPGWPYFIWEIMAYPFGFHINAAMFSNLFHAHPVRVMWTLALVIEAVVHGTIAMLAMDLAREKDVKAAVLVGTTAAAGLAFSPWTLESFCMSAFYSMNLGLLLTVAFIWVLVRTETLNGLNTLILTLMTSGLALSYPTWGPLIALMFGVWILRHDAPVSKKALHSSIIAVFSLLVVVLFAQDKIEALKYMFSRDSSVFMNRFYLSAVLLPLVLLAYPAWKEVRSKKIWMAAAFPAIVLGLGALMTLGRVGKNVGSLYYFYKLIYAFVPAAVVFCAQGVPFFYRWSRSLSMIAMAGLYAFQFAGCLRYVVGHEVLSFLRIESPRAVVNPEILDMLFWVKDNVPQKKVTYLTEGYQALLHANVTGKPLDTTEEFWWVKPGTPFSVWKQRARPSDIALVPDVRSLDAAIDGGEFRVLYEKGVTRVIMKSSPMKAQ